MNIGQKIQAVRELLGVKQETLAAQLKISQKTVSKLEQARNLPFRSVERIVQALQVAVNTIFMWDEQVLIQYLKASKVRATQGERSVELLGLFNRILDLYERLIKLVEEKTN